MKIYPKLYTMVRLAILQIFRKRIFWNITVRFSHVQLKEDFQKSLKDIRNNNKVQEFCGVLVKAKEVTQEPDDVTPHLPVEICLNKDELDAHLIICKLRDIIHQDKNECVISDTILRKMLNSSIEARKELDSLLSSIHTVNFLNPNSQNSKEYLKSFINDVESFLENANEYESEFSSKSNGILKMLEKNSFSDLFEIWKVRSMLQRVIFNEKYLSEELTRKFGSLVADAVSLILTRLSLLNSASKSTIEKCLSLRRSSLPVDEEDASFESSYLNSIDDCYLFLKKVSLYHMTREERLQQCLKDVKSGHNAYKFYKLLGSINPPKHDRLKAENSDSVMNQLKDIISAEKPEYNMLKHLLMAFCNHTHHLKEVSEMLSRFFSDVDNFDFQKQNSKEFLTHFILELEHLIYLHHSAMMFVEGDYRAIDVILFGLPKYTHLSLYDLPTMIVSNHKLIV